MSKQGPVKAEVVAQDLAVRWPKSLVARLTDPENGFTTVLETRTSGNFAYKALYLNNYDYDFHIITDDDEGCSVLVVTRRLK